MSLFLEFAHDSLFPLLPARKEPLQAEWRTSPCLNGSTPTYLALGYNIGYRIPPNVLVMDVDPRNGGDSSFLQLPIAAQSLPVTVYTRDKGRHFYLSLPDSVPYTSLQSKVQSLSGIDFLHHGRYVVAPGSTMVDSQGQPSAWTLSPAAVLPPPPAPESLLSLILKPKKPLQVDSPAPALQYLSPIELEAVLSKIPVTEYRDNDSWLKLLMASHHATNGDGLDIFLQWSLQDPQYYGHEEIIKTRWDSLSTDKPAPVTIRTLVSALAKHGTIPTWLSIRAGLLANQRPEDVFKNLVQVDCPTTDSQFNDLVLRIESTDSPVPLLTEIALSIATCSTVTDSMREILFKQISKKTGVSIAQIRKDIKKLVEDQKKSTGKPYLLKPPSGQVPLDQQTIEELENLDKDQLFTLAARAILQRLADEYYGVPPAYCQQSWWLWTGLKWSCQESNNVMDKAVCTTVLQTGLMKVTDTAVKGINSIMRIYQNQANDFFEKNREKIRVFTPGCVLEFDQSICQWVTRPHDAKNGNRYVISTAFDPEAGSEPPTWLRFLSESTTSEQARRTIACAIIYAATDCRPWLRRCFYLYGPKRSGKSTTLNLIEALLGRENCSSLSMTQIGSKHGSIGLLTKLANIANETLSKRAVQDDVFKQLISGESVSVEPKFKEPFSFRNHCKLFFGANVFPKINDDSDATWDRITVLSFPNSVPEDRADLTLERKLARERSAVLNWAMLIFAEEYEKDQCRSAMAMDPAGQGVLKEWQETNSPALAWAQERLLPDSGAIPISAAYHDYALWCNSSGHYVTAINHFSRLLTKTFYKFSDAEGRNMIGGVKLKTMTYEK